jgi:hypothetical protein
VETANKESLFAAVEAFSAESGSKELSHFQHPSWEAGLALSGVTHRGSGGLLLG